MNDGRIAPHTPCFLVHLEDFALWSGRVCEVLEGPLPDEHGDRLDYLVTADWITGVFGALRVTVARQHLRPMVPPPAEHVIAIAAEH